MANTPLDEAATPSLLRTETTAGNITTPAAGKVAEFVDSADHHLKRMDANRVVTDIEGGGGGSVLTGAVYVRTCDGRLTTESGVPVSSADRTAQSTIYFTPFRGDQVSVYTGAEWITVSFTELSLALSSLTSGKQYDVFITYAGSPPELMLELSAAWNSDTAMFASGPYATMRPTQNGVPVKSTDGTAIDVTSRYIGTFRTTGTTTTEDSLAKRFVYNAFNQVRRGSAGPIETTDTWVYSTRAFQQANANAANRFEYVDGDGQVFIEATVVGSCISNGVSSVPSVGVGIDSTTVNSAQIHVGSGISTTVYTPCIAMYRGVPGIGYHAINWLETGNNVTTVTWRGDQGNPTETQTGIVGTITT